MGYIVQVQQYKHDKTSVIMFTLHNTYPQHSGGNTEHR